MKFVIEIHDYMLSQIIAIQDPKSPMSFDDTLAMLIAQEYERQKKAKTLSTDEKTP